MKFHVDVDDRIIHEHVGVERNKNKWKQKQPDLLQYMEARNGDHLMTQFVCELCVFRILKERNPDDRESDTLLLEVMVRVTLDAFWSRA